MTIEFRPTGQTACDREPIQAPGSIQPHGMLVVATGAGLRITHVAGDLQGRLGAAIWPGLPLAALLGNALTAQVALLKQSDRAAAFLGQLTTPAGALLDVSAHLAGGQVIVELEPAALPAPSGAVALNRLSDSTAALGRTTSLATLCDRAATEFRQLTGFDRVMVYRFQHDDAGAVIAEDRREGLHSFLHQHFPASDIPRQARDLYVRNLIRVIPDITYRPAALHPAWAGAAPLDMSDCSLRSVSPVHLQYLANMGVAASASVSIVIDGLLWGLIACHHETPRAIPYDIRAACCALAGSLAGQLKARKEADSYRQQIRLTSLVDEVAGDLARDGPWDFRGDFREPDPLRILTRMMDSDGIVILRGAEFITQGHCPPEPAVRALAAWLLGFSRQEPIFETDCLSARYPQAAEFQSVGSGLLAMTISPDRPWLILWFRAEVIETIRWAGNPHKAGSLEAMLTPRASFAAWQETVRAHARRWSLPELDAARRLRLALLELQQVRQMEELNRQLTEVVQEKNLLLQQKDFLVGEINHRVQNSLQLVSSFLSIQARASASAELQASLEEARRRLKAVSVVHRRLYRGEQVETVDAARYLDELCEETVAFMGPDWATAIAHDLSPVVIPTSLAVPLGLVLTELLININKHAYGGGAGPVTIRLSQQRGHLCLVVADQGKGATADSGGFGARIVGGLMKQLGGTLAKDDNRPGLRTTIMVPLRAQYAMPAV